MRTTRRQAALLTVVVSLALANPGVAQATHGPTSDIKVGQDGSGATGNSFDPGLRNAYVGQTLTWNWVDGFHNVTSATIPAGAATFASPTLSGAGDTFSYTFTVAGTFSYYCSIHASAADANGASYPGGVGSDPDNGKMVGRIEVLTDSTGPVWGGGSATATASSASQIDLTWPTATDPETGISGYEVYASTSGTKPGSPTTTVSGTSWSHTGLAAGSTWNYWITALNGSGSPSSTDQTASATTTSVAASATASGAVTFAVNPTLQISVGPSTLDLGTADPVAPVTGQQQVTVKSNDTWSLAVKSIGRNNVDESPGDDASFTNPSGSTIPVSRMSWDVGGGATAMSDVDATVLSSQPATTSAGAVKTVDLSLQLEFEDPPGIDYMTVVLYTATQP